MPAERLSMRKIKEVLRLHAAGQSQRAIAQSAEMVRRILDSRFTFDGTGSRSATLQTAYFGRI